MDIDEESSSAEMPFSIYFFTSFKTHAGHDKTHLELLLTFFSQDYKSGSSRERQRHFMASGTMLLQHIPWGAGNI